MQRLSATLGEGGPARVHVGDFDMPMPPMPPEAALAPRAPMPPMPPMPPGHDFTFEDFNWGGAGPRRLGIEFDEVSGQFAKFLQAPGDQAVVVTSVLEGSAAAKAGLKAGDVILRFGGHEIRNARDLRSEVRKAESGKELVVGVQRDGKAVDLKVTLGTSRGAAPELRRDHLGRGAILVGIGHGFGGGSRLPPFCVQAFEVEHEPGGAHRERGREEGVHQRDEERHERREAEPDHLCVPAQVPDLLLRAR